MVKKPKAATEPVADEVAKPLTKQAARKERMATEKNTILELDMNLEDYEDFEPIPDGGYPATVHLSEMRTSDKGNDYYYVVFQIHPDDFPADYAVENAPEGLRLVYARVQKPDPRNRRSITGVKNFMRALGMPLRTSVINPGEWEGKKAKLLVGKQEWNGEVVNTIKSVEALD